MVESNIINNNISSLLSEKHLSGYDIKMHLKSKIQQIPYYKNKEEKESKLNNSLSKENSNAALLDKMINKHILSLLSQNDDFSSLNFNENPFVEYSSYSNNITASAPKPKKLILENDYFNNLHQSKYDKDIYPSYTINDEEEIFDKIGIFKQLKKTYVDESLYIE